MLFVVANRLTTSSEKAIVGIDFNFTCSYSTNDNFVAIAKDNIRQCSFERPCRIYDHNINYICSCNDTTIILTIPRTYDIDTLHGTKCKCYDINNVHYTNSERLFVK